MGGTPRGILISFDGIDCSGKETQTNKLVERLKNAGRAVQTFQTPDYTTPSGQALKAMLQDINTWKKRPWPEKMKYFADNRAEHREEVIAALETGEIVIYDRYIPSSLAFVAVEAEGDRTAVQAAVRQYEYVDNRMPKEDLSFFLDVPPSVSNKLLHRRKARRQDKDEYTDHREIQENLYHEYELLYTPRHEQYLRLICHERGELKSIETISEEIWNIVQTHLS